MAKNNNQRSRWRNFQTRKFNSKQFLKNAKKAETATVKHAHKFLIKRWDSMQEVRQHVALWLVVVGGLIAVVGLQILWFQRNYQTEAVMTGGTYAEGVVGSIDSLNPLFITTSSEASASQLLFSSLYDRDSSGSLRADLAKDIDISDDGREYNVTLRSDATWHDGNKVTAEDVGFTVELIKDPSTRASRSLANSWQEVEVEVVDLATVKFTLPSPYAAFKEALTFSVVPKHLLEDIEPASIRESSYSHAPIGSGPFQLRRLQVLDASSDRRVVHLTSNNNYYRGAARLTSFQLHVYPDADSVMTALSTGEINAAADVPAAYLDGIDRERYKVTAHPVSSGVYAIMNTDSSPLGDRKVREALRLATDTDEIRSELSEEVTELHTPFVKGQIEADMPGAPSTNVKRARKILSDAGWKLDDDGHLVKGDSKLTIDAVTVKNSDYEKVLSVLSRQWREIGVTVDTKIYDPRDISQNFHQAILQPRSYSVLIHELQIGADPDVYAYWHSSGSRALGLNFSNYSNAYSDDTLSSARFTNDKELRHAKYAGFAHQWLQDVPAIGLYQPNVYYVASHSSRSLDEDVKLVSARDRYADILYWGMNSSSVYSTP